MFDDTNEVRGAQVEQAMNGEDHTLVEVLQTAETNPDTAKVMDIHTGSEDEVLEIPDITPYKVKVIYIHSRSEDKGSEDEENATEHQEATVKTNGVENHNLISNVNPAQAGVSLIPLDVSSSVDTMANKLAHMVYSTKARQSQTQGRGDQDYHTRWPHMNLRKKKTTIIRTVLKLLPWHGQRWWQCWEL